MLVPLGRLLLVPGADRLDPYETLRYRPIIGQTIIGRPIIGQI
jgi:hypothetical protein